MDALTPSERRVARLAAGGRSNKEIAHQLFVTVRTVETHLSHVYDKLDLNARDGLTAVLDENLSGAPRCEGGAPAPSS